MAFLREKIERKEMKEWILKKCDEESNKSYSGSNNILVFNIFIINKRYMYYLHNWQRLSHGH